MDTARQIRFAMAPFFLYGSILLGAVSSHRVSFLSLSAVKPELLVAIGAALIAATLPVGFMIGVVSLQALRLGYRAFTRQSYEIVLTRETWNRVWSHVDINTPYDVKDAFYAGVTFDHEILSPGLHEWITRRWSAFNFSVNAVSALLLAHVVGVFIAVPQTFVWWLFTLLSVSMLVVNATFAWRHTMNMLDFQSRRNIRRTPAG